jgi:high-affinity nickel-transport protein
MVGAYGWAFLNPIRKIWYNLTITAISALVAMLIGGIEALGLIADKLELNGAFWDLIGKLNKELAGFGYFVVGIFIASWIASYLIYRWRGFGRIVVERA